MPPKPGTGVSGRLGCTATVPKHDLSAPGSTNRAMHHAQDGWWLPPPATPPAAVTLAAAPAAVAAAASTTTTTTTTTTILTPTITTAAIIIIMRTVLLLKRLQLISQRRWGMLSWHSCMLAQAFGCLVTHERFPSSTTTGLLLCSSLKELAELYPVCPSRTNSEPADPSFMRDGVQL